MKTKTAFVTLFLVAAAAVSGFCQGNIINNPSFEDSVNGKPSLWNEAAWLSDPGVSVFSTDATAHSGKASVAIENKIENHAYFTQSVALEENSFYKYSAWIKADGVGSDGVGACIGVLNKLEISRDVKGKNSGFEQVFLYLQTGKGISNAIVLLSLGSYGALNKGKAWFDDVELVKVSTVPEGSVICYLGAEQASSEQQQPVDQSNGQTAPKSQNAMIVFVILGLVVLLGGVMYYVLFVLKKKDKNASDKKPE